MYCNIAIYNDVFVIEISRHITGAFDSEPVDNFYPQFLEIGG